MQILTVLVGFPACGKSTYARELAEKTNVPVLSSDSIREELYGNEEEQGNPKEVFNLLYSRMEMLLKNGDSVILDATNINRKDRSRAIEVGKRNGAYIVACYFDVPTEVCKERNLARERKVPEFVYDKMAAKFEMPSLDEGFDLVRREAC